MTDELPTKLLPRNLTARAAYVVAGNPINTRPESGVDNSHPGLEYDQRMMSRSFFPGLVFDFQYGLGAKLVAVRPELFAHPVELAPADLSDEPEGALWLWYIGGRFGLEPDAHRMRDLYGQGGYDVVRAVTDLEDDTIVVIVGRQPEHLEAPSAKQFLHRFLDPARLIRDFKSALAGDGLKASTVLRDDKGAVQVAVLVGPRAKYLTSEGVIDPALTPVGHLTQSLCSPWQWDFADCGCYYWAGSKPDIVKPPRDPAAAGEAENLTDEQRLNFQRRRWHLPRLRPATTPEDWHDDEMSQPDMVQHWESLPFVLDERETDVYTPQAWPVIDDPWDRDRVIEELLVVATAEHAVCCEYLYACYSLKAPPIPAARRYAQSPLNLPPDLVDEDVERRVFAAAHEIFMMAVDEMRHLRWANEAIMMLGGRPTLDRADIIGRHKDQARIPFKLAPLTRQQLDDFISIEKPSPFFRDPDPTSLDGIYTHMLISIWNRPQDYPEPGLRLKLLQLIKLIVDEGLGHYERFVKVKQTLDGLDEADFLAVKTPPERAADPFLSDLQDLADGYYDTLLRGVCLTLEQQNAGRGVVLEQARRSMYNLHDTANRLARSGHGVLFTLPAWLTEGRTPGAPPQPCDPEGGAGVVAQAEALTKPTAATLEKIAQRGDAEARRMTDRHKSVLEEVVANLRRMLA